MCHSGTRPANRGVRVYQNRIHTEFAQAGDTMHHGCGLSLHRVPPYLMRLVGRMKQKSSCRSFLAPQGDWCALPSHPPPKLPKDAKPAIKLNLAA